MKDRNKLKKWEIALALALWLSLGRSALLGDVCCGAWWGVIFPQLTDLPPAQSEALPCAAAAWTIETAQGPVELRFRLLDTIEELKQRWS